MSDFDVDSWEPVPDAAVEGDDEKLQGSQRDIGTHSTVVEGGSVDSFEPLKKDDSADRIGSIPSYDSSDIPLGALAGDAVTVDGRVSSVSASAIKEDATSRVTVTTRMNHDLVLDTSVGGDSALEMDGLHQTSYSSSSFMNMFSSFSYKPVNDLADIIEENPKGKSTDKPTSPVIISHRRQASGTLKRQGKRHSSTSSVTSPLAEVEKPKELVDKASSDISIVSNGSKGESNNDIFSEEKYLDTSYRYASEQRNIDFHDVFKSSPQNDNLLDDYSCTLSREFLYQGRLYVTGTHVCFNSNLLGWVSKLVIPFKDIIFMEKTSAAGLFPNAISIETTLGKTQFNGFASRDDTFALVKAVWARVLIAEGEQEPVEKLKRSGSAVLCVDNPHVANKDNMTFTTMNDSLIEQAINSVDEYSPNEPGTRVILSSDGSDMDSDGFGSEKALSQDVYRLKPDSGYTYTGPYYGHASPFPSDIDHKNEKTLVEFELNASPGLVFQLIFGDTKTDFWTDFFKTQKDLSNVSPVLPFGRLNEEGLLCREYEYDKALNYPVGPSFTRCYVDDAVHHDEKDWYFHVVNTTRTPDVPSGGSFSTKTRYLFRWASETTCLMRISYWVDWTGSSWIKGMIESSIKSGQTATANAMEPFIADYVSSRTEAVAAAAAATPEAAKVELASEKLGVTAKQFNELLASSQQVSQGINKLIPLAVVAVVLLVIDIYMQLSAKSAISQMMKSNEQRFEKLL